MSRLTALGRDQNRLPTIIFMCVCYVAIRDVLLQELLSRLYVHICAWKSLGVLECLSLTRDLSGIRHGANASAPQCFSDQGTPVAQTTSGAKRQDSDRSSERVCCVDCEGFLHPMVSLLSGV